MKWGESKRLMAAILACFFCLPAVVHASTPAPWVVQYQLVDDGQTQSLKVHVTYDLNGGLTSFERGNAPELVTSVNTGAILSGATVTGNVPVQQNANYVLAGTIPVSPLRDDGVAVGTIRLSVVAAGKTRTLLQSHFYYRIESGTISLISHSDYMAEKPYLGTRGPRLDGNLEPHEQTGGN